MGWKKGVEGENASNCLLRCNREKPQELTKFARLFLIFSYIIIFDSFTAQLFIILSKNILNSFIKQPAQISDGCCSMTSKLSVIFSLSLENCEECFLTNISHLRNEKGIQVKCPAEKIKKVGAGEKCRGESSESQLSTFLGDDSAKICAQLRFIFAKKMIQKLQRI